MPPVQSYSELIPPPEGISEAIAFDLGDPDGACFVFRDGKWATQSVAILANTGSSWRHLASAPRDGSRVLCWAEDWQPAFLVWKTNPRLWLYDGISDPYFGSEDEDDDEYMLEPENHPTHWYPLPQTPTI